MANTKKKKEVKNNVNDLSPVMMIGIFVIFILAMIFITYFGMHLTSPISKFFSIYNTKVENELSWNLGRQKTTDDIVRDVASNTVFTIDNPNVMVDPYGISKLSALVIFTTEEETYVKVNINDMDVTTMEKSKTHIIPIYYLYNNAVNLIKLTLDDGRTKTLEVTTKPYDSNNNSFNVASQIGFNDIYYMAGDINSDNSALKGYDSHGNMISYIVFGHIGGFTPYKNKLALSYNQDKGIASDVRVDIDPIGRIKNITSNTSDVQTQSNISGGGVAYVGAPYNLYSTLTPNYTLDEVSNADSYTEGNELSLESYEDKLRDASKYPGEFKVSYMGDYISYTGESSGVLYVVNEQGVLRSYKIENKGIIKTDVKGDKSLFINVDGTIYSLKTTLKDNIYTKN